MIRIIFPVVDLGGSDPVHQHLRHITPWHLHALNRVSRLVDTVIEPVVEMMLVSALVVEPGGGIALRPPFCVVGASETLIIFTTHEKLAGRIFAHIVKQPLAVQTHPETALRHKNFVMRDRLKMFDCVKSHLTSFPPEPEYFSAVPQRISDRSI